MVWDLYTLDSVALYATEESSLGYVNMYLWIDCESPCKMNARSKVHLAISGLALFTSLEVWRQMFELSLLKSSKANLLGSFAWLMQRNNRDLRLEIKSNIPIWSSNQILILMHYAMLCHDNTLSLYNIFLIILIAKFHYFLEQNIIVL